MRLFCDCGHIKAHLLCGQPSHPCPSAPVLNSKLLCTAATVVKATSHFTVQLPKESRTVCDCWCLATGVGPIMHNFNWCLHRHCHRILHFVKARASPVLSMKNCWQWHSCLALQNERFEVALTADSPWRLTCSCSLIVSHVHKFYSKAWAAAQGFRNANYKSHWCLKSQNSRATNRYLQVWHSEDRAASSYILITKASKMKYLSALFWRELHVFRTSLLSIVWSLNTVFTATGICHGTYVDCDQPHGLVIRVSDY